jgi:hypothetical protein
VGEVFFNARITLAVGAEHDVSLLVRLEPDSGLVICRIKRIKSKGARTVPSKVARRLVGAWK